MHVRQYSCDDVSSPCRRKRWTNSVGPLKYINQGTPHPLIPILFSSWSVDISIKDDVTIILHLGVFFLHGTVRQFRADFRAGIGYQPKNIFFQGQPIIVVCCYSPLKMDRKCSIFSDRIATPPPSYQRRTGNKVNGLQLLYWQTDSILYSICM
jgi:hypothetical protein